MIQVKALVSIFKHASLNDQLPPGYKLIQEVETRFGTTHDVVVRFLKSFNLVVDIIDHYHGDSAKKMKKNLSILTKEKDDDDSEVFPALQAICDVFSLLRHAQTELQASQKPTLMKVLPMLEDIKQRLLLISNSITHGSSLVTPHKFSSKLAKVTLSKISEMTMHDMWFASCVLHPGLRSFSFMPSGKARESRAIGEALVEKMVSEYQPTQLSEKQPTALAADVVPDGGNIGEQHWSLSNKFFFLDNQTSGNSELSIYLSSGTTSAEQSLLQRDEGVIDFWLRKKPGYPILAKVALRVHVTPATNASSERDFSGLKGIIDPNSTCLKDDIVEALAYVKDEHKCSLIPFTSAKNGMPA